MSRSYSTVGSILLVLSLWTPVFAQSTYGTISGTVEDISKAVIPGVTVTATDVNTGVVTTVVSNEAGAYNFPSLLPGTYNLTAELPGFQTETYDDVQLGNAAQIRLNFTLKVNGAATSVEVRLAVDTLLATSSSSIGVQLTQQKVHDLPLVSNNVQDLVALMPGVVLSTRQAGTLADGSSQASFDAFVGGVNAGYINVQRDGVNNSAGGRYGGQAGFQSATVLNPDMVSELRVILAPVDAELGRGNGQIQVLTRSGTNRYTGSAVWNVRNSALDTNTWANNRTVPAPTPNWTNVHQYTLSLGGPIKKNKSFFFVLWDGVVANERTTVNSVVLTPCARNGIFRYFDNINNGAANVATTTGTTPTTAVVDFNGNPVTNLGPLRYASVFGRLPANLPAASADCSNIAALVQSGTNWDSFRKAQDGTGYVGKILNLMPQPNNYVATGADGLNTAGYQWLRSRYGSGDTVQGTPFSGANTGRKQINGRFDHNFDQRNKLGISYTYELTYSDGTGSSSGLGNYPTTIIGHTYRRPQVMTANFTSTLSPNLVNEARVGLRRTAGQVTSGLQDQPKAEEPYLLRINGYPVFPKLGTSTGTTGNASGNMPFGDMILADQSNASDVTPLLTYGDTLSWTRGKHAFKFGGELRKGGSKAWDNGFIGFGIFSEPRLVGGDLGTSPISTTAISATNMPGLAGTATTGNNQRMRQMLSFLAGSLGNITQLVYMQNPTKLDTFEDYKSFPQRLRDDRQNEFSFFLKDDWKVRRTLTLNVGVRYDYFGVPWEANGITAGILGGSNAIFGISGRSFNEWFSHTNHGDSFLTQLQFVGPNTPNTGKSLYPKDWNNFGPAIGFAWQVPWFGEGKTTVRGGYQLTYQNPILGLSIPEPGVTAYSAAPGIFSGAAYLDMANFQSFVPVPVPVKPMAAALVTDRTQTITAYDPKLVTPYVQNLTLAVTRSVRSNLTADLRYVGTLSRKQMYGLNVNIADYRFNGLQQSFDIVRAGGESDLLNSLLRGVTIPGSTLGAVTGNAGAQMRASSTFNSNLAIGNYAALAASLNTLPVGGFNAGPFRATGYPDNFIVTNPQFSTTTLNTNLSSGNYHSMQAQLNLRETHGISGQFTYTWSKSLGLIGYTGGPNFIDPVNRKQDYTVLGSDRTHDFRANGTFALPLGPSKLLFRNSSGVFARVIEGWQLGWISDISSGAPLSLTAQSNPFGVGNTPANTPDVVGPFDFSSAGVRWGTVATNTGLLNGSYFDLDRYKQVPDPQCSIVASWTTTLCTLDAIQDTKTGQIVLQNPLPGRRGTLGLNTLRGPVLQRINANLSKSVRISETKTVQLRIDADNVLNHPTPANPTLGISNSAFGTIAGTNAKTGSRRLQGSLRLNF